MYHSSKRQLQGGYCGSCFRQLIILSLAAVDFKRVIVDECVGTRSSLFQLFQASFPLGSSVEVVRLAEQHRAIPDEVILRRLMDERAVLVTSDRVLHNRVCRQGYRSYTLDPNGVLTGKPLPNMRTPQPTKEVRIEGVKSDYTHEPNPIAHKLKEGFSERDFKRYRTRRRRIRSHFGSEANLGSVSLTVGARSGRKGWGYGFHLAVAGHSGVKGLRASEGYGSHAGDVSDPAWCLIHALRELYLLQLENVPTQLFIIPPESLALAEALKATANPGTGDATSECLRILMGGLKSVSLLPCVKGRFFEAMESKLQQLTRIQSNEIVPVDFPRIVQSLLEPVPMPSAHLRFAGSSGTG